MWARCKCGADFWREDGEGWKRLCVDCWRAAKAGKDQATDDAEQRATAWYQKWQEAKARIRQLELQLLRANLADTPAPSGLDLATLKKMRSLCHPDRHSNSATSNEITQRINQMIQETS